MLLTGSAAGCGSVVRANFGQTRQRLTDAGAQVAEVFLPGGLAAARQTACAARFSLRGGGRSPS